MVADCGYVAAAANRNPASRSALVGIQRRSETFGGGGWIRLAEPGLCGRGGPGAYSQTFTNSLCGLAGWLCSAALSVPWNFGESRTALYLGVLSRDRRAGEFDAGGGTSFQNETTIEKQAENDSGQHVN